MAEDNPEVNREEDCVFGPGFSVALASVSPMHLCSSSQRASLTETQVCPRPALIPYLSPVVSRIVLFCSGPSQKVSPQTRQHTIRGKVVRGAGLRVLLTQRGAGWCRRVFLEDAG